MDWSVRYETKTKSRQKSRFILASILHLSLSTLYYRPTIWSHGAQLGLRYITISYLTALKARSKYPNMNPGAAKTGQALPVSSVADPYSGPNPSIDPTAENAAREEASFG